MLCEVQEALRLLELLERETLAHPSLHLVLVRIVRNQEDHVVSKAPERFAFRALAFVDRRDDLGDDIYARPHGECVVVEQGELRSPVAYLVRYVEGSAHKRDHVERSVSTEDLLDPVVELRSRFSRVHMALFASDDLPEVRFGEEAHPRFRPGAVVEVCRVRDELFPRLLDEAQVRCRGKNRVTKILRRDAPEWLVECQGVEEYGPSRVGRVGRHAHMVPLVDFLCERFPFTPCDVVADRGHVRVLSKARHDLLTDGLVPGVDVVHVDGGGVDRPLFP